jgi:hypothetical protein
VIDPHSSETPQSVRIAIAHVMARLTLSNAMYRLRDIDPSLRGQVVHAAGDVVGEIRRLSQVAA